MIVLRLPNFPCWDFDPAAFHRPVRDGVDLQVQCLKQSRSPAVDLTSIRHSALVWVVSIMDFIVDFAMEANDVSVRE